MNARLEKDEWKNLRNAIRDARFEDAERHLALIDWSRVERQALEDDDLDAVMTVSMSAELLDYLGRFDEFARRISKLGERLSRLLRSLAESGVGAPHAQEDFKRLKSRIWALCHFAMLHYRKNDFNEARKLFTMGITLCERYFDSSSGYSARGTTARLFYGLGLVDREQHVYSRAKENFLKSVMLSWPHQAAQYPSESAAEPTRWADLAVARATGLGLAYIYYDLGQPFHSLPMLLMCRLSLARLDDRYLRRMLDITYYNTLRSAYGGEADRLDEAILGLRTCFRELQSEATEVQGLRHDLYAMRAAHSLALALLQRVPERTFVRGGAADLDEAEKYCGHAERLASKVGDKKIGLLLDICRSRVERKRGHYTIAADLARRSLEGGAEHYPMIRMRAATALAEALMGMGNLDAARKHLETCDQDQDGTANPRLHAIALLRLAEVHTKFGEAESAGQVLARCADITNRNGVTSAQIRELEGLVRADLRALTARADFVIRFSETSLNREKLQKEFCRFLAQWAKKSARTDKEAAEKLDISRQTLFSWLNWEPTDESGETRGTAKKPGGEPRDNVSAKSRSVVQRRLSAVSKRRGSK